MSGELRPGRVGLSPEEAQLQPLYARVIGLQYLNPGGVLCFFFFEGAIALAVLLALAELVTWWAVLILPATVGVMVKINDLVAGAVVRSAAQVPAREQERFRREVTPVVGRATVPDPAAADDAAGEPTGAPDERAVSAARPSDVRGGPVPAAETPGVDPVPDDARSTRDSRGPALPGAEPAIGGAVAGEPENASDVDAVGPATAPPIPVASTRLPAPAPPGPEQLTHAGSAEDLKRMGPGNGGPCPALRVGGDPGAESGRLGAARENAGTARPLNAPAAEHLQRPARQRTDPTDRMDQADTPEQRSRQSASRRYE